MKGNRNWKIDSGQTGPAQSAFRDLDSRKVRTPGGRARKVSAHQTNRNQRKIQERAAKGKRDEQTKSDSILMPETLNTIQNLDKSTLALWGLVAFGYLVYLFIALFRYLHLIKQVLLHNISLGLPIEFSFGWKGVRIRPVKGAVPEKEKKCDEGGGT